MALLVFQAVPYPCRPSWGYNCGPQVWALPPWDTAHVKLSPGRGVCVVFHVLVCVTMAMLACAGPSWQHTLGFMFPGSWRARGAISQALAGLVVATNPRKSWRFLGRKSPNGHWSVAVSGHIQHSVHGGGGGLCRMWRPPSKAVAHPAPAVLTPVRTPLPSVDG